jgi:hypothetical protein
METLQPLINLLVLLTALSLGAERVSNLVKLRNPNLKAKKPTYAEERDREHGIAGRTLLVGVILAVLVKADFFAILAHLDDPWRTLGWVQLSDYRWMRSPATANIGTFLYTLAGSVLTGIALSFGSKFWHDVLGTVYEVRSIARNHGGGAPPLKADPGH